MIQQTISRKVFCTGIGVHNNKETLLTLCPAPKNTGIIFIRTDVGAVKERMILALFSNVSDTHMCTRVSNIYGHSVGTIEHLMAALYGLQVDNVMIEINQDEVPIMDGSALHFVKMLNEAGLKKLDVSRSVLRVVEPVQVEDGGRKCALLPSTHSIFEMSIDFGNSYIGYQEKCVDLSIEDFGESLSDARTFGFLEDKEKLQSAGYALGASLDNVIVLNGNMLMNEGGLRSSDEFIRHKLLDAVGDICLAGYRIMGHYKAWQANHAINNQLLHKLFSQEDAFEIVTGHNE